MRRKEHNLQCGAVRRRRRHPDIRGFTLVEILIVVIILGILATIVIPQFTAASQDARRSSLASQLQTLRAQIDLYKLQHVDENPPGLNTAGNIDGPTAWAEMTVRTDYDHTPNLNGKFGPYLQTVPLNPLSDNPPSDSCDVLVVAADVVAGAASGAGDAGWVYNRLNGKLWATSKSGDFIYDEMDPQAATNGQ
jgi:general secretion pathway protein G